MPLQDIKLYFYDQLAVSSEASTQFEGAYTVEVKSEVQLGDELRLSAIVEAPSVIALTDDLVWVMIFDDALAVSSTVESEQSAYKQSVIALLDELDIWSELPLQESEIELTDELVLDIISVFLESVIELSDELVMTDEGHLPLGWQKVTPHIPVWTKVVVN